VQLSYSHNVLCPLKKQFNNCVMLLSLCLLLLLLLWLLLLLLLLLAGITCQWAGSHTVSPLPAVAAAISAAAAAAQQAPGGGEDMPHATAAAVASEAAAVQVSCQLLQPVSQLPMITQLQKPLNSIPKALQQDLWKGRYDFSKADAILSKLGLRNNAISKDRHKQKPQGRVPKRQQQQQQQQQGVVAGNGVQLAAGAADAADDDYGGGGGGDHSGDIAASKKIRYDSTAVPAAAAAAAAKTVTADVDMLYDDEPYEAPTAAAAATAGGPTPGGPTPAPAPVAASSAKDSSAAADMAAAAAAAAAEESNTAVGPEPVMAAEGPDAALLSSFKQQQQQQQQDGYGTGGTDGEARIGSCAAANIINEPRRAAAALDLSGDRSALPYICPALASTLHCNTCYVHASLTAEVKQRGLQQSVILLFTMSNDRQNVPGALDDSGQPSIQTFVCGSWM
jgi:hypothetical protein